jgi:hypothetical protein
VGYSDGSGAAWAQSRQDDHDLHIRAEQGWARCPLSDGLALRGGHVMVSGNRKTHDEDGKTSDERNEFNVLSEKEFEHVLWTDLPGIENIGKPDKQ